MSSPVALRARAVQASWAELEPGDLVVVDRTGVFLLSGDPLTGCAPALSGGLDPADPVDLGGSLRALPEGDGSDDRPPVRTRSPLVLEKAEDGFVVAGSGGDGLPVAEAVATVLANCRRPTDRARIDRALAGEDLGVDDLRAAGLLAAGAEGVGQFEQRILAEQRAHRRLDRRLQEAAAPGDGDHRTPVTAVWVRSDMDEWMPLALGYLLASIRSTEELDERYRADLVVPRSATDLAEAAARSTPGLYLFSDYVWNVAGNLALSAAVKEADPHHLTVHGGPSVPGYEADRRAFLDEHPSVDVLVHGEGEITIRELLGRLAHLDPAGPLDAATACEAIAGLAGTTVRTGEGPVTGPARDRIEDLASVPSPFLTGVFDDLVDAGLRRIVLETNRGCPFRCSFCDWGSATNTRIRTFPLDRVEAEIEWAAANRAEFVIMADANFGMLPRDEQITEWVAGHHESTGFPVRFGASMAKNPNDRFASIIERMRDAGLLMGAGLSLQTYDPGTLDNIDRRNIPRERYDGIWDAFRSIDVPMGAEFMIGLPGCTRETFRDDLQFAVDREVSFLVHRTAVLPNAPMNDPDYRDRFGLVTDADHNLIATESYSPEDLREMLLDYQAVYGADHLGTLRVVLRFLRQRTGRLEADLAVELAAAARSRPADLPAVRWVTTAVGRWGCPPAGWDRFLAEVRRWIVADLGLADDAALASVLAAQRAMLPHPTVEYPITVPVEHDVGAWFAAAQAEKLADGGWADAVDDLAEFGPGRVVVDDPWSVRDNLAHLAQPHGTSGWELDSPFRRPGSSGSHLVV